MEDGMQFRVSLELLFRPFAWIKPRMVQNYGWDTQIKAESYDRLLKKQNHLALRATVHEKLHRMVPIRFDIEDPHCWYVGSDQLLQNHAEFWGCKMVSRAFTTNENWKQEFHDIYGSLQEWFEISIKGCSTHVQIYPPYAAYSTLEEWAAVNRKDQFATSQISPSNDVDAVNHLKNILKGVIYFEYALTAIMPADRKICRTAWPNVLVNREWRDVYRRVPAESWGPLFRLIDSKKDRAELMGLWGTFSLQSWSFSHIAAGFETIEFRRPPGSLTSTDAIHWVCVALGLVLYSAGGLAWPLKEHERAGATNADFRRALLQGLSYLNLDGLGPTPDIKEPATTEIPLDMRFDYMLMSIEEQRMIYHRHHLRSRKK